MLKLRPRLPLAALTTTLLLATGGASSASAQSSDNAPSVAEAARRAREKKTGKPVRTLTDDNLQKLPASDVSVTGAAAQGADAASPPPAAAAPTAATQPVDQEEAKLQKAEQARELEKAKKELAQAEHELDVLQRKQALDDDAYHSKADYQNDTAGKAQLDQDRDQIEKKKISVQAIQDKIAALKALGADTSEPNKVTPPN